MSINYKNCNYCNIILDNKIYYNHIKYCKKIIIIVNYVKKIFYYLKKTSILKNII